MSSTAKFSGNMVARVMPVLLALIFMVGCNLPVSGTQVIASQVSGDGVAPSSATIEPSSPVPAATETGLPPRILSICTSNEPSSLFLYGDASPSARSIRQALYDGPADVLNYQWTPVLLTEIPTPENGGITFEPVMVSPGEMIVSDNGLRLNLGEGVAFHPPGCASPGCTATFSGQEPVQIDQMVVRFRLRQDILWSDGAPLTVDDSVYSYEVAKSMYPGVRAELVDSTQSYKMLDENTLEWRGIPGFRSSQYATFFFTPLPRHAWNGIANQELPASEIASRQPLSYGPYQVTDWLPGESLSLQPNPYYFRAAEGLPHFDELVFHFVQDQTQALERLVAGDCDLLDESYFLDWQSVELKDLEQAGKIKTYIMEGTAWETITFGLMPVAADGAPVFSPLSQKELRQALASCVDRQQIVDQLFNGQVAVLDSYVPSFHPFANPDISRREFNPQSASASLQSLGWLDVDGDPLTPRISQGVAGVPDGTPLTISYLVASDDTSLRTAQIVSDSLVQCGVGLELVVLPQDELLAPGPGGPVFGRQFQLAQFSWASSLEPACFLYLSTEIPGPYPVFPKGWGGANPSGFSNPGYDQVCLQALGSLPGDPGYMEGHKAAQGLIADETPILPLYLHNNILVTRPDFCGLELDPSVRNPLWNMEEFNYGQNCQK